MSGRTQNRTGIVYDGSRGERETGRIWKVKREWSRNKVELLGIPINI